MPINPSPATTPISKIRKMLAIFAVALTPLQEMARKTRTMPVPISLALSAPARAGNSAWIYSVPMIAHMAITAVQATE
ncbi:hypothetical protein D3C81_1475370 [compost metagenome]